MHWRPLAGERLLVDIVPSGNHIQEGIELAVSNPFGTLINVEDADPVLVEPSITWAGATLQPLVGSFNIEWRGSVCPPKGSRQIFARGQPEHSSCCPQFPVDVTRHSITSCKQPLVSILEGSSGLWLWKFQAIPLKSISFHSQLIELSTEFHDPKVAFSASPDTTQSLFKDEVSPDRLVMQEVLCPIFMTPAPDPLRAFICLLWLGMCCIKKISKPSPNLGRMRTGLSSSMAFRLGWHK
jgi:hypothetical protein